MTSDGDGGPRRTGAIWLVSTKLDGGDGGGARLVHSEKKRCSAISVSSPTTKPRVVQPRRAKVQRQMLDASKPINKAINRPTGNCTFAEACRKARAPVTTPEPTM